jgi:hypothetical protein
MTLFEPINYIAHNKTDITLQLGCLGKVVGAVGLGLALNRVKN